MLLARYECMLILEHCIIKEEKGYTAGKLQGLTK